MTEMVVDRPTVRPDREQRQRRVNGLMRVACGLAWIAGPPIALILELMNPQLHAIGTPDAGTAEQQLALLAAHSGEVMALRVGDYLFELAIFVGWLGIARLLWNRYPVLGLVSGVLAVIGLTGAMGVVAVETMRLHLAEAGDHSAMAAAYTGLDSGPMVALFLPLFLVLFLGLFITAIAVLVTGVLSRIAAAALLAFIVIDFGLTVPFSGFWILVGVGLVWGWQLLRMSTARWRGEVAT